MKHFVKTNAKRITAAILCAVMCIAALPFSAFAFTAEEGKKVDAYYGAKYVGYDGEKYHSPATYQYITYDSSGNVSLHSKNAGGARTKLMIKDSSGARQVLCIESGVDYNANGTYTSESGKNNSYFQNLPAAVQYGLMLTSIQNKRSLEANRLYFNEVCREAQSIDHNRKQKSKSRKMDARTTL